LTAWSATPKWHKTCKAMFMCDTPLANFKAFGDKFASKVGKARELRREGGYDGAPVVLMHSTDVYVPANLAPGAKALLEGTGMTVDMRSMDWQTLVSRRARRGLTLAKQVRVLENPTHALLGQWYAPVALRRSVTGNLEAPATIF